MVYTIEEIKERISPVASRYGLKTVYLFGSYARGESDNLSDIDLAFEEGSKKLSWSGVEMVDEIKALFDVSVDCLPVSLLENSRSPLKIKIANNFRKDRILLYEE